MPSKRYEENLAYAKDPRVAAFLDALAAMEGTKGYNSGFGNTPFDVTKGHPNISHKFKETTGKTNTTNAAGRYQFMYDTWTGLEKKLPDIKGNMSPQNQDVAAIELIRERRALDSILKGDFDTALRKTGPTWASNPYANYKQPKRSIGFAQGAINAGLEARGLAPVKLAGAANSADISKGASALATADMMQAPASTPTNAKNIPPVAWPEPVAGQAVSELDTSQFQPEGMSQQSQYLKALNDTLAAGGTATDAISNAAELKQENSLMAQIQQLANTGTQMANSAAQPTSQENFDLASISGTVPEQEELARQQDAALAFLLNQDKTEESAFKIPSAVDRFLEQKLTAG